MPHPSRISNRGSALVITLAFLVLVTILVVGLASTMRLERVSARTHLERTRAMDYAQMGIENVVGQLHSSIANTNIGWISFPGQIISSGTGFGPFNNTVNLYSGIGTNTTLAGTLREPNLNAQILQDQNPKSYLITDRTKDPSDASSGTVELPLRWIYLRQSGALDDAEPPDLTSKTDPIVGRYAYWADDESSKINYNLAWRRDAASQGTNQITEGHPSKINLPSLPGMTPAFADTIHSSVTTDNYSHILRLFNSPYDARQLGSAISGIINTNKFDVTHYNHDPETTFFNQPRIALTTQEKYAPVVRDKDGNPVLTGGKPTLLKDPATGAPYFLDILKNKNTDPGILSSATAFDLVDQTKLNKTINLLKSYLQRSDWPMTSAASSLQSKYYSGDPTRLTQLALNIIDYVRSKESAQPLVDPLRGVYTGTTFSAQFSSAQESYCGLTRTPMITELGVWLGADGKQLKIKVELYLPPKYGLDQVDIGTPHTLAIQINGQFTSPNTGPIVEAPILASECSTGSTILHAGQYVTVTRDCTVQARNRTYLPTVAVFSRAAGLGRLDVVPVYYNSTATLINCPIDPITTSEANITSCEVDDPRVNKTYLDWKIRPLNSGNTFGAQNSIWSVGQQASDIQPQQDTDAIGKISAASLYMPYPKGDPRNPTGLVTSVGELGYVHTGVECYTQTTGTHQRIGTPWRTLRLQPNNYSDTTVVPDWAFMDLFSAPVEVTDPSDPGYKAEAAAVLQPHGSTIAGRINMNAQAQPFGNPLYFAQPMERIYPLKALFEGAPKDNSGNIVSSAEAEALARSVYNHTLAAGGKAYGNSGAFDSQGEVVEIRGVADGGEESEALVRSIASLISSRGSVFRIYAIGQSVKQTPNHQLVISSEQRLETMVERYLDTSSGTIKFRSVYFRNLTP